MLAAPRRDLRQNLTQVPDPLGRKGSRHVFTAVMTAVVGAMLQGCRGYEAIAQWLAERPLDFTFFGHWGSCAGRQRRTACESCCRGFDMAAFEATLTHWITDLLGDQPSSGNLVATAIDSKSLRGTWNRFKHAVHLLTVVDVRPKYVLHQRRVPPETNEYQLSLTVLENLVVRFCLKIPISVRGFPGVCSVG
jgi:hypothetical protein